MVKNILICIDRDGTLIYDDKFHLGRQRNWKSKVKILPKVIHGLKKLDSIPNAKIYMITNQPGVSVKDFPLLTKKKVNEVCEYIINILNKNGAKFSGFKFCGKANTQWKKKHPELKIAKKDVGNFSCWKPNPGMVNSILKDLRWKKSNTIIYTIGDRVGDVALAKNFKGWGIKVPFKNRPGEVEKFEKLKYKKKYLAKDFSGAVGFILRKEIFKPLNAKHILQLKTKKL